MIIRRLLRPSPCTAWAITAFNEDEAKAVAMVSGALSIAFKDGKRFEHQDLKSEDLADTVFDSIVPEPHRHGHTYRQMGGFAALTISAHNKKEEQCAYLLVETLALAFNAYLPSSPEARTPHRHDSLFSKEHPGPE